MAIKLPDLIDIDYTSLDFQSIIDLVTKIISDHPDYFADVDDFTQSNAGKMTIELTSYIISLLAERVDWVANENFLPTATQRQNVANLLKLINYRLELPKTSAANVTATISQFVEPFVIPARYSIPARDLDGNVTNFEMLLKNDEGQYIYDSIGSGYEFDTGFSNTPILSHNDLVFYQGTSYQEFRTMSGINNEVVQLTRVNIEEDSIRVWRITRDTNGNILSRRELPNVDSFISPEAQSASASNLQPFKIQISGNNGAFLVFGEEPVVEIFSPSGNEEIMIWYRVTEGETGNIPRNGINYTTNFSVSGQLIQINFVNPIAGSGGEEAESIANAKRYAPLTLTTAQNTVNPDDFIVLLQNLSTIINSVTYGKSNEPVAIRSEFGYHIPPFEAWIYPLFDKPGWESFPTYSYQKALAVGRPYTKYGPVDKELIKFSPGENNQELYKLKEYALNDDTANIIVSNFFNTVQYVLGVDFVIDLEAREVIRLDGGGIADDAAVVVQYFEGQEVETEVTINFTTGETQPIPEAPIFPGLTTYAWSLDTQKTYLENTLSIRDYNYPNNDYRIDYANGNIIRNDSQPILKSKTTLSSENQIINGVNNEFIISFDGLNRALFNSDHDFEIDCYGGWYTIGTGGGIALSPGTNYSFQLAIDGGELVEYEVLDPESTLGGTTTPEALGEFILNNATSISSGDPISNLPIRIFADGWRYVSPRLTFASKTKGAESQIELDNGGITGGYTDLFNLANLVLGSDTGAGEELDVIEMAFRARGTLNSLGLCTGFAGLELAASEEEKPEIYSKANLSTPFTMPATENQLEFTITGTNASDGTYNITFTNTTAFPTALDLDLYQDRLTLIDLLQSDIDSVLGANVIEAFWLRIPGDYYRIGFRLADTASTTIDPTIEIDDGAADSARILLQFSSNQNSKEGNLVECRVDPQSNMTGTFFLQFVLNGARGENALIQVKANNALHNNTLSLFNFADNQIARGSGILIRTLLAADDIIDDGGLNYIFYDSGPDQNNEFVLQIEGSPNSTTYPDGDYKIVIPAGNYNINQLVSAINTALVTSDLSAVTKDISTFIICEKVEGESRIRFRMTDFSGTAPEIVIAATDDPTINEKAIDKLGFKVNQSMADASTILLHYAGNWISDPVLDQSEERSINRFLEDNRLISQDHIIMDPELTAFDIKGIVYCAKGFDRNIISVNVKNNIRENFTIDKREFAEDAAITNITNLIEEIEGTVFTDIEYFGKDYQLYRLFTITSNVAIISGTRPAENIVSRWDEKSAFKITIDGTASDGVNKDGTYLVIVGNDWTDRDYDSLLSAIAIGDGVTGGLQHAIPLTFGGVQTDISTAVTVSHNSGIFKFETINEGPRVMIGLDHPDEVLRYGYQNFVRTSNVLESEYTASSAYTFDLEIDGNVPITISITSPASGSWTLSTIAESINTALPVTAASGIDSEGKIRVTSLLGGSNSTIDISAGGAGLDLLALLDSTETAVDGEHGYISCLDPEESGTIYIDTPAESYGTNVEPTKEELEEAFNYKTRIPARYDEILFISDDYYTGETTNVEAQRHGIILEFVELGAN